MIYTETNLEYEDEILRLARDPNLSREKGKTSKLILLIHGFPLTERTVSRLCQLSLSILQTLEKIELQLKNWAFMSLDMNSSQHFDASNPHEIKTFNANISLKVIESCQELTVKLNKISTDMDFITKALRNLTPMEFLSDSGTLLTSLALRNIRLKDELRENITIAYLKAKLITIGTNLEQMLEGGTPDQRTTVVAYKQFVASLLGQLDAAIQAQDEEDKTECLAVISDMEQMFEAFKLEYVQGFADDVAGGAIDSPHLLPLPLGASRDGDLSELHLHDDSSPTTQSISLQFSQPIVYSITRPQTLSDLDSIVEQHARRGLFSSVASTSILQKLTLSEELPYLMSAFNLAKTLEEDVFHYKGDGDDGDNDDKKKSKKQQETPIPSTSGDGVSPRAQPQKHFPSTKHYLPQTALYTNSHILPQPPAPSASSYLYTNDSLLSKLGIKPQVISATLPRHLNDSTSFNKPPMFPQKRIFGVNSQVRDARDGGTETMDNKENKRSLVVPLTQANLLTHTSSILGSADLAIDLSHDYVE